MTKILQNNKLKSPIIKRKKIDEVVEPKKWPRSHKGHKHIMEIVYYDPQLRRRVGHEKKPSTITGIMLKFTDGTCTILNLDSEECTDEYRKKLEEWDTKIHLPYWCGMHNIPYTRFLLPIMRYQIIKLTGTVYLAELMAPVRRRTIKKNKNSKLKNCNKIFTGFDT